MSVNHQGEMQTAASPVAASTFDMQRLTHVSKRFASGNSGKQRLQHADSPASLVATRTSIASAASASYSPSTTSSPSSAKHTEITSDSISTRLTDSQPKIALSSRQGTKTIDRVAFLQHGKSENKKKKKKKKNLGSCKNTSKFLVLASAHLQLATTQTLWKAAKNSPDSAMQRTKQSRSTTTTTTKNAPCLLSAFALCRNRLFQSATTQGMTKRSGTAASISEASTSVASASVSAKSTSQASLLSGLSLLLVAAAESAAKRPSASVASASVSAQSTSQARLLSGLSLLLVAAAESAAERTSASVASASVSAQSASHA